VFTRAVLRRLLAKSQEWGVPFFLGEFGVFHGRFANLFAADMYSFLDANFLSGCQVSAALVFGGLHGATGCPQCFGQRGYAEAACSWGMGCCLLGLRVHSAIPSLFTRALGWLPGVGGPKPLVCGPGCGWRMRVDPATGCARHFSPWTLIELRSR
jgi:hypothetical protein